MNYTYVTGDGEKFDSRSKAIEHAEKVYRQTGGILSVERRT